MRRSLTRNILLVCIIGILVAIGVPGSRLAEAESWDAIVSKAQGQTVDWFMYGGSPSANGFVNGYVAPQVKELYGITLRQVPVNDIAEVVSKLLIEKQAGKTEGGEADLLWINGENFRTCKRYELLYGPFADQLPNQQLVNWERPSVRNDFGEPVEGLESPYGSAQVVMVYDTARISTPPATLGDLLDWVREHPGRFTYPAPPDFTGSAFVRHVFYHVSGEVQTWQGAFDEQAFETAAAATYQTLRDLAPFLWREGNTYP
ncbi:ABC transporter substrate-binding protein, partial [candidate division KSB3 bacterium]|nr:ABC transporter substrate-binding protein [candidate division KSB3 bacterium]MBD3324545.1 ABC transporter substrate-binding protein [candidate division KSB3 bacterium]